MNVDYYAVLGVAPNATLPEIKTRFRFLSHAYHPDKFGNDAQRHVAEEEFKRINNAYQIVSDPDKRARFDASRPRSSSPPPPPPRSEPPKKESPPINPNHRIRTTDGTIYIGEIDGSELYYDGTLIPFTNIKRIDQSEPCGCQSSCGQHTGSGTVFLNDGTALRVRNWRDFKSSLWEIITSACLTTTQCNFYGHIVIRSKSLNRTTEINIRNVVSVEPAE